MQELTGRRYDTGQLIEAVIDNGRIASIRNVESAGESAPWIAPGFVDLQINGYGGQEFNDLALTVEKVAHVCLAQDACGVTSYLPTVTTQSFERLSHALSTIARACETVSDVARRAAGIHLEGPYISSEDGPRGAHPRAHCRPPDWQQFQRLQEAAQGRIRVLTLSPEYDDSAEFVRKVTNSGVLVAIGHTAANSAQIRSAVDAGARLSTHLGNGAHGQIRRHPNYIWDQLAEDRLNASLIADGHHLPAEVVKTFVRAKTPARCLLVSDIVGLSGLPPGRYADTGLGDVEVLEDGRVVVAGQRQYLAGASLPIGVGVANVMNFAGVDLKTAIEMASLHPTELIGHEGGKLEVGAVADLVAFELTSDNHLSVTLTVNAGEVVYSA